MRAGRVGAVTGDGVALTRPRHVRPRLPTLLLAILAAACGSGDRTQAGETAEAVVVRQPRQVIVLVDLSASQAPAMLGEARAFLDRLISELWFGDRLVLLEVHQAGVREAARRWVDTLPSLPDPSFVTSRDRHRLKGDLDAARSVSAIFFDPERARRARHTDLFSTLHVAAEFTRAAGGHQTVLVVLSDMLQSAGNIEMEGLRRMPPEGWIDAQRAAGLLPRLDGACVMVVGADATTPEGAAVRDFWLRYFEAAGARLRPESYRLLAPGGIEGGC